MIFDRASGLVSARRGSRCLRFVPGLAANLLPYLAEAKAFEPKWSHDIYSEWMRNLRFSMGIPLDKIEYLCGETESARITDLGGDGGGIRRNSTTGCPSCEIVTDS